MCSEGAGDSGRGGVGNRAWEAEHTDCSSGRGEGGIQNEAHSLAWRTGMRWDDRGPQEGDSWNKLESELMGSRVPHCPAWACCEGTGGPWGFRKGRSCFQAAAGSKGEGRSWKDHVTCIVWKAWLWWLGT